MIQEKFAAHVVEIVKKDSGVIGLAAAGSWITNELDEYSDLDLLLVTKEKIGGDKKRCCHMPAGLVITFPDSPVNMWVNQEY